MVQTDSSVLPFGVVVYPRAAESIVQEGFCSFSSQGCVQVPRAVQDEARESQRWASCIHRSDFDALKGAVHR